jgi:energy-coupling factor transporter transmembrane protein EcfT
MSQTPKAHLFSSLLGIGGILITHSRAGLVLACMVFAIFLISAKEVRALLRCIVTLLPIAAILFAVDLYLAHSGSTSHTNDTLFVVLRLSALMLAFSHAILFFLHEDSPDRLIHLGLRGSWLVVALSAISTLPLMQLTARRIIDARYAAGMAKSRSILSSAFQLPYVLRPLFTQALRLAVARSDNWQQRGLMDQFEQNALASNPTPKFHFSDYVAIFTSIIWLATIILIEIG